MVRGEPRPADRVARLGAPTDGVGCAMEWSPTVGGEHLATRERAALFDTDAVREAST